MNERDVSRRNEERYRQSGRESWRGSERGMGARAESESHGPRRWGAGEDWDEENAGRAQRRYAGDYESGSNERSAQSGRMGRSYAQSGLGRDEENWSQGRRESQRWGEEGTYGAQGSNEFERYGSDYGRDREYSGRYGSQSRGEPYSGQGYGSQGSGTYETQGYGQGSGNRDYTNQRGYGTQAHGQGEHSYGTHGYGSGREFRGYEGGEAGRQSGLHHWERGFGEGYGLSSGYADEQAYGRSYGSDDRSGMPRESRAYGRSYRGMGPKSYTRSDERVLEDVNERLTEDDILDASDITVRCVNGVITLEGVVGERWMKHRAEDLADASSGVKQVDNRIQVQSQAAGRTGSSEQRSTGESTTQGRSRQGSTTGTASRTGDNPNAPSQH